MPKYTVHYESAIVTDVHAPRDFTATSPIEAVKKAEKWLEQHGPQELTWLDSAGDAVGVTPEGQEIDITVFVPVAGKRGVTSAVGADELRGRPALPAPPPEDPTFAKLIATFNDMLAIAKLDNGNGRSPWVAADLFHQDALYAVQGAFLEALMTLAHRLGGFYPKKLAEALPYAFRMEARGA